MKASTRAPAAEPDSITEDPVARPGASTRSGVALALTGVEHSFGSLAVLDGVELSVDGDEVVGIVGPSGCGKSTLLEIVAGLLVHGGGTVTIGGETAAPQRLAHCAYMPQRDLLLPWLRALDNAALALRNRGVSRRAAREAALPLFEHFGLAEFAGARPRELSGGMRQRVAFLRTLLSGKPVLLLDEPFASLDAITRAEMQEWLAGALREEARTALLVSHDVEEALYLCDRVVVLSPRPATAVAELSSPAARAPDRTATVTSAGFAALRERALEALRQGAR